MLYCNTNMDNIEFLKTIDYFNVILISKQLLFKLFLQAQEPRAGRNTGWQLLQINDNFSKKKQIVKNNKITVFAAELGHFPCINVTKFNYLMWKIENWSFTKKPLNYRFNHILLMWHLSSPFMTWLDLQLIILLTWICLRFSFLMKCY